jgi:hypothetical protein
MGRGPEKKWSKVYTTESARRCIENYLAEIALREIDVDKMSQDRNKSISTVTKWETLLSIFAATMWK